ncbi:MAG: hypothetical protein QOE63_671, partial [Acidimicrobiaceae bacterium]
MYLFARSARLGPGDLREQLGWAVAITEKVNQIGELEVSLWSTLFSPGLGTLAWTCVAEDLAQLEAVDSKLMADEGYHTLVTDGAKFASGDAVNDGVIQLVHADESAATVNAQYASVVQAVLAPGAATRGVEIGVEIAQRAKKITGQPTSFGAALTGVYGGVEWISVFETVDQLQKGQEALG